MARMTITEALAELKTIDKRIEKKREFVGMYLIRQEFFKDPLEKDGGAVNAIREARQSIRDLEERKVTVRREIAAANAATSIIVEGQTRSIIDWLTWRREIAPGLKDFLGKILGNIRNVRNEATKKGYQVISGAAQKPDDIVVNVNEQEIAEQAEMIEKILGVLDGQLSLKNATTFVDV